MIEGNENIHVVARREALRKWARRGACLAALGLLVFGGYRGYTSFRKQHLAKQTDALIARGDFKSAVLVARRLLQLDENNLAACRAMAEMAEKLGRAEALVWRKKIAHLTPEIAANQLALARSAMRFAQLDVAEAVLKALPESARSSVEYHQVAATAALVRRDSRAAEQHLLEALRLAPQDAQVALSLASLRLTGSDTRAADDARQQLALLSAESAVRVDALRALAADALVRKDKTKAIEWSAQLTEQESATFSDWLLRFQAVEGTEEVAPVLEHLQAKAASSPSTAVELITSLNRQGLARVALHWSMTLPREIAEAQPVPLAVSEAYSFLQDWAGLHEFVEGKNWGALEALRLAVHSHALHRLSPADRPSMEAETLWRAALQTAHAHPEQLVAIAQLAEGWGYEAEAVDAWWDVANTPEHAKQALSALQRRYKAKQDTRGLLRVAKRALELNPNDLIAANNCASLGLLLNGDSTARRLAAKLREEHPNNRAVAATYAFALQTEGKTGDALRVMASFKEDELRHPSIAAYYVVMLVDGGELERARSYLTSAERASLLPEERQLLQSAARRLL